MLRIVSKASTLESFVELFSRSCNQESLYVVTRDPVELGTSTRFVMTLASGQPVLQGFGQVVEVRGPNDPQPGPHPGMRLRLMELDAQSRAMVQQLAAMSVASSGPLSHGPLEPMLQCSIQQEADASPLLPGAAPVEAPRLTPLPMAAQAHPMAPQREYEPTQVVRPLGKPLNRKVVLVSAAVVLVIGVSVGLALLSQDGASSHAGDELPDTAQPAGATAVAARAADKQDKPEAATEGVDAAAQDKCTIAVHSKPEGATVHAAERELGKTPLDTSLPCGETVLRIERPYYEPWTKTTTLTPGRVHEVSVTLGRPKAELEVISEPAGATVMVNGKKVGVTPTRIEVTAYVRATVSVRKPGFQSFRKRFYPKPPKTTIEAMLRKRR